MSVQVKRRWRVGRLIVLAMSWPIFEWSCVGTFQREMEVLLRPEANPTLIRESFLYDRFGPGIWEILKYW